MVLFVKEALQRLLKRRARDVCKGFCYAVNEDPEPFLGFESMAWECYIPG